MLTKEAEITRLSASLSFYDPGAERRETPKGQQVTLSMKPFVPYGLVTLDIITASPVGNILGGFIFGIGFAFAGYCPGTSIGAIGEGKIDARYTVAGGLVGVLVYTLIQQYTGFSISAFDMGKLSLADLLPINPFSVAVIFSAFLISVIYLVDLWEQKKSNSISGRAI